MDSFLYSINATLPIFLMIILGKVLWKLHIIDGHFTKTADKYVFLVALPALVFKDLTENDIRSRFNGSYVLFCFLVTLFCILAIWGLTELFMKKESEKGAFIQASYRSSAAILGLAFIDNMYDGAGMAPLMIIGAVPLYNIFAVIILTLKGTALSEEAKKPDIRTTLLNVCKNPILLSIVISLPFAFLNLHFPAFINKTINSVANTATPLALLSIGASFEGRKAIQKLKPTILASFIKLVLLAALFLPVAIFLGYRNQELMAILIMLGSPATVSCYIMAKNTGNDSVLTSSIIVLTTLLSSVTLTGWIFILHSMELL
jgi:hypothetical protein